MPTNRNYEDAARAALNFATKAGSQNVAPLLPTRELRERMEKGERVVLVPGQIDGCWKCWEIAAKGKQT